MSYALQAGFTRDGKCRPPDPQPQDKLLFIHITVYTMPNRLYYPNPG
jgi:hypothetical protein